MCSYPSSLYTNFIVWKQVLYLTMSGSGWGPCIRLLATSKGIFVQDPMTPDIKPIVNLRKKSTVLS